MKFHFTTKSCRHIYKMIQNTENIYCCEINVEHEICWMSHKLLIISRISRDEKKMKNKRKFAILTCVWWHTKVGGKHLKANLNKTKIHLIINERWMWFVGGDEAWQTTATENRENKSFLCIAATSTLPTRSSYTKNSLLQIGKHSLDWLDSPLSHAHSNFH